MSALKKRETVTPYGKIKVSWKKTGKTVLLDIETPSSVEMTLRLPEKEDVKVQSGHYEYTL